jgi:FKBP-type peptidyl-prolyl cis-trans isomerase FkpA
LDGSVCYSSETSGPGQIKIGQSGKEFGLDEGILKMKSGERAHFILPPYLAHGLIGDMEKIPARSTIVYDIEIIEIIDF